MVEQNAFSIVCILGGRTPLCGISTAGEDCLCERRRGRGSVFVSDCEEGKRCSVFWWCEGGKAIITGGFTPRNIWGVEELETLLGSTKPRTSHHRTSGGERGIKRGSAYQFNWIGWEMVIVDWTSIGTVWRQHFENLGRSACRKKTYWKRNVKIMLHPCSNKKQKTKTKTH